MGESPRDLLYARSTLAPASLIMLPLEASPKITDFVLLNEYKASTPKQFSLEESPVLYYRSSASASGHIQGPVDVWVTTNGVYFWQNSGGNLLNLNEIALHAMDADKLYIQGNDIEIWLEGPFELHTALTECIEAQEYHSSSEGEGYSINDTEVDLQTGQGDDEIWDLLPGEDPAAAAVRMGSLGKRRRDGDF